MVIGTVISNIPIVGSLYGLVKTSMNVYTSTSPIEAVQNGLVGVFLNCTPPAIKYPILCSYLLGSAVVTVSTGGNPVAISSTVNAVRLIVEAD
jgi:hypothetical protein